MAINRIFAENLKGLVKKHGSVSKLCRDMGINRTQFNRYLSGDSLPHQKTIEKLSQYFCVSELSLFSLSEDQYNPPKKLQDHPSFQKLLLAGESGKNFNLPAGRYLTHFYSESDIGMVIRSITVVKKYGDQATFARLTGMNEPRKSRWVFTKGRHEGLVVEQRQTLYFMALDCSGSNIPTLLAMHWTHSGDRLLIGYGLITGRGGPMTCNVVMSPLAASLSFTHCLRLCTTIDVNDRSLDENIRAHLLEV